MATAPFAFADNAQAQAQQLETIHVQAHPLEQTALDFAVADSIVSQKN